MSVAEPLEGSARMPGKAGFLDDVAGFDHRFFGISPREAAAMDPQQRLLLEVAWEALEDAGVVPAQVTRGRCGVYIGSMWTDYARLFDLTDHGPHSATGLETSLLSGRLSHLLGLTGPSLTVSTACSSSLVAVHLACQSLLSGETSIALAGGVNLLLTPDSTAIMKAFGGLSPRERCRTFDSSADGYVRGEGCGVLVLKPLSTALEDGDPVHGVILGSAVNHNGHVGGVTASSIRAQKVLIRAACASAGISPTEVDYVEAHGTGTAQGDPVELRALKSALCEGRPQDHPLWVGSVKTNIGHLEAAAGVAGLVKVLLALRHRLLPAHLHLKKPHPEVDPALLRIPVTTVSWPSTAERALAGVSSFGFSGTNAHVVVQQAPPLTRSRPGRSAAGRARLDVRPGAGGARPGRRRVGRPPSAPCRHQPGPLVRHTGAAPHSPSAPARSDCRHHRATRSEPPGVGRGRARTAGRAGAPSRRVPLYIRPRVFGSGYPVGRYGSVVAYVPRLPRSAGTVCEGARPPLRAAGASGVVRRGAQAGPVQDRRGPASRLRPPGRPCTPPGRAGA